MCDTKFQTCCFTGHRHLSQSEKSYIKERLSFILPALVSEGYCYFGAGGAYGFDMLAEQAVLDLRKGNPHIKLILVLPGKNQTQRWPANTAYDYRKLFKQADKIVYCAEGCSQESFLRRNRRLVDYSSVCVCFLSKSTGGTAYTVRYAQAKGLRVIYV